MRPSQQTRHLNSGLMSTLQEVKIPDHEKDLMCHSEKEKKCICSEITEIRMWLFNSIYAVFIKTGH